MLMHKDVEEILVAEQDIIEYSIEYTDDWDVALEEGADEAQEIDF